MDKDLKQLLTDWFWRTERGKSRTEFWENPQLPEWLLKRITVYEPFRARAVEDASVNWAMPQAIGVGMELFFPETVIIEPFRHWKQTVHQLTFQFGFGTRMEGDDWEKIDVKLERVGFENGAWRIIEICTEDERRRQADFFKFFKACYAEKRIEFSGDNS